MNIIKIKKGAMFGLDARIALAIFGALSVISGAALFSTIKNLKAVSVYTEISEIAKANEAYLLDYGKILGKQADTDEITQSTRKIVDLVTVGEPLSGTPYLSYKVLGDSLQYKSYGEINIYTLSVDSAWGEFNANTYCSLGKSCNVWVGLKGFSNENEILAIDDKYDDGLAESGDIRYDIVKLEIYVKSISVPNAQHDFTASGVWVLGSWGGCSGSCGSSGTKTRSVTCSTSFCSGAKPSTSSSCTKACTGTWSYRKWLLNGSNSLCTSGYRYGYQCRPICVSGSCDPSTRPSSTIPVYKCDSPPSGGC